jgi:hypothetical protein
MNTDKTDTTRQVSFDFTSIKKQRLVNILDEILVDPMFYAQEVIIHFHKEEAVDVISEGRRQRLNRWRMEIFADYDKETETTLRLAFCGRYDQYDNCIGTADE